MKLVVSASHTQSDTTLQTRTSSSYWYMRQLPVIYLLDSLQLRTCFMANTISIHKVDRVPRVRLNVSFMDA